MNTAIYVGSFNPFHAGHQDILQKASQVFDVIYLTRAVNRDKPQNERGTWTALEGRFDENSVKLRTTELLLVDYVQHLMDTEGVKVDAIVKGLRNSTDLEYEKAMQYTNEDLGLDIPTVYFVADRKLTHVSSSAIRQVNAFKERK